MTFNLTPSQKDLTRWIVNAVRAKQMAESFSVNWELAPGDDFIPSLKDPKPSRDELIALFQRGRLDALAESKLLLVEKRMRSSGGVGVPHETSRRCTLTGLIYKAVDTDFAEDSASAPVSTLAQPHPPEIAMSLDRLRTKFPDPKKLGFLVMRFTAAKPFAAIVEVIKRTAAEHGLAIVRADENEFQADLWGNVRTHLHGCGFGIAIYERIETDEPNANIGLEVGYLMAMNKPVLLLKDRTVETLQADLAGKLYKPFDPHDPATTIPAQLTKWFEDYGIVVPRHG